MELIIEYPVWFVLLCLFLAFLYAFALYFRYKKKILGKQTKVVLFGFRFITVFIVSFLLLGPLLINRISTIEKPLIIFAQDNSSSVLLSHDSVYLKGEYPAKINSLIDKIQKDYNVLELSFASNIDEDINFRFNETRTNFTELFNYIDSRVYNRNIGAMIIATDGLYNEGRNPYYSLNKLNYPVYTIALGDTVSPGDIRIDNVYCNDIVFAGSDFPVEVDIAGDNFPGQSIGLEVWKNSDLILQKNIVPGEIDKFLITEKFMLPATGKGTQHYEIKLQPFFEEENALNNTKHFFVNVLESKQKILIYGASPHPDIAAFYSVIEQNPNYDVDIDFASENRVADVTKYNLLILHQLPAKNRNLNRLDYNEVMQADIPLMFVLGEGTDLNTFNELKTGLEVLSDNASYEDVYPVYNQGFMLFTFDEINQLSLNQFPPLRAPFGTYNQSKSAHVFLKQRIGSVVTDYPLISFLSLHNRKIAVLAGTGIWRWRLSNYLNDRNHNVFNEIIGKSLQFLSLKTDNRAFRVKNKDIYEEGELIEVNAELYNENFELINAPEVNIVISNSDSTEYPYTFGRKDNFYSLNAGILPVGDYAFYAETIFGEEKFEDQGQFFVSPSNMEMINMVANHQLLHSIAETKDARMFYPQEIDNIPEELNMREDIHSISYYDKSYLPAVNLIWILVLIVFLVSLEWFLRKYLGLY